MHSVREKAEAGLGWLVGVSDHFTYVLPPPVTSLSLITGWQSLFLSLSYNRPIHENDCMYKGRDPFHSLNPYPLSNVSLAQPNQENNRTMRRNVSRTVIVLRDTEVFLQEIRPVNLRVYATGSGRKISLLAEIRPFHFRCDYGNTGSA